MLEPSSSFDKQTSVVLLTAPGPVRASLRDVFAHSALANWEIVEAENLEHAHFILQHGPCDVWLIDDQLCKAEESHEEALWTARRQTPVLLLADPVPQRIARALDWGCEQWLDRERALQPLLLQLALRQTLRWSELRRRLHQYGGELHECRRRVHRMIDMLWESVPDASRVAWLTQRHMMLRVQEEIDRSDRHATPLTVVLGEVSDKAPSGAPEAEKEPLVSRVISLIAQSKRRCDVVGQYGPNCFLLLLVQTPAEGAIVFCARLRQMLQSKAPPLFSPDQPFPVEFGVAGHSAGGSAIQLLGRAERSLERTRRQDQAGGAET